ncbi:hypothetical protein MUY27_00290 [Mucilaginibacter sp. RS28]|uniref:Uncharacterized protein n=1 Tax=Mucilaginibacter straminoryzae TaxID=2932774 RepID=A0A9X1X219_9SPHI|nr:hypothetical protein [Mucilaginibacter straminoryzae]MCJ8208123.1 hypothetical protein [Mucilaginibacter straminoryzae]
MKYLIDAARQYGLDEIADRALENPNVHGIIVDVHPLWLMCYGHYLRGFSSGLWENELFEYALRRFSYYPDYNFLSTSDIFQTTVPFDLGWLPRGWDNFFNKSSGLLVRIQLRPGSKPVELGSANYRLSVVQEHSPVVQFSASAKQLLRPLEGGVSIGYASDPPGTLGGILKDTNGQCYGLTCGHVIRNTGVIVDQPSSIDYSTPGSIGSCVYNCLPFPNNGNLCNPRNTTYLNDMDIALVELDPQIQSACSILNIGSIKDYMPANNLHPNLKVEFNGRSSGHQTLVTGGIGLVMEVEDTQTGQKSCVKDLIEIKQPSLSNLVLQRPVKGGDSGAWITINGTNGLEWAGMIIGENRQAGFAIHSEDILTHLNSNGYSLTCI